MIRKHDTSKIGLLHRKMNGTDRPKGVPRNAQYSHTVWGISKEENAIVHTDGRFFIPRNPVPVYKKPNVLHM